MTEAEILTLIQDTFRRRPALLCAYIALRLIASSEPSITLTGGVRGWAVALGCSLGYPKTALNTLADEGYIEVLYGDNGDAVITLCDRSLIADQSTITAEEGQEDAIPQQNAESLADG